MTVNLPVVCQIKQMELEYNLVKIHNRYCMIQLRLQKRRNWNQKAKPNLYRRKMRRVGTKSTTVIYCTTFTTHPKVPLIMAMISLILTRQHKEQQQQASINFKILTLQPQITIIKKRINLTNRMWLKQKMPPANQLNQWSNSNSLRIPRKQERILNLNHKSKPRRSWSKRSLKS